MPNNSFISSLSSLAHVDHSLQNCQYVGRCAGHFVQAVQSPLQYLSKVNNSNNNNKFWQQKQIKNKFWVSKLYGCMFPGSPCHSWTKTDGNILYLALLLLLGGDATQFSFRMVSCLYRPHSKFFFCTAEVIQWSWSKSCALLPHPISLIIIHSYIVQMVVWEKSSFSSYTPSFACAIASHSSLHDISVTTSFIHKKFQHWTPGVFWFTIYYIIISL